jgi:hypothetical protein
MKSIAHQADQVVRKLISAKLQELKGNGVMLDLLRRVYDC